MDKTLSGKYSRIKRRYGDIRKKRAISFLNLAQCTAAFNDNLFKFLTIFLLINMKGTESATSVTILISAIYVLPFLLFSSIAGAIADKFSKQKIIVWMKAFEILIIALGYFVYANGFVWGCYLCVFLLSLQSAIMSPPKYSIISELVSKEEIAKANSYVTSYTYVAIIVGTFMASLLTHITGKNFMLSLSVCMIAAITGFIASLNIPKTEAVGETIVTSKAPFSQLKETLQMCEKTPKLLLVVFGSAFFLFIGAFLQANMIPFAINSLGMSEVGGGYLSVGSTLGIAVGSIWSGKLCKKEVHLGVSALGMLGMALLTFFIPLSGSAKGVFSILCLFGIFGGLYQVPLESYMQTFCASEKRGKVVGAANFLSFAGVLLAPISMFIFGILGLSAAAGFVMLGVILCVASVLFIKALSIPFMNFLSKSILHKFYNIYYQDFPFAKKYEEQRVAIFVKGLKKRFIFLLFGESMHSHIFVVRKARKSGDKALSLINGVDVLTLEGGFSAKDVRGKIEGLLTKTCPIFLLDDGVSMEDLKGFIQEMKKEYLYHSKEMELVNRVHFRPSLEHIFQKTSLVFSFENREKEALLENKKGIPTLV